MPRSDRSTPIGPEILADLAVLRGKHARARFSKRQYAALKRVIDLSVPLALASARGAPVVIVPGGMACSLFDVGGVYLPKHIWINSAALVMRRFFHLRLARFTVCDDEHDRKAGVRIKPGWPPLLDPLRPLYRKLEGALDGYGFTPHRFLYDWRKDMEHKDVGKRLLKFIKRLAAEYKAPVHIITHSQGAMVARWAMSELATAKADNLVGQVILLGPANYGAFVAALAVGGCFREIPLFQPHGPFPPPRPKVQRVLASFTALYQLMPWDDARVPSLKVNDIRDYTFWRGCNMAVEQTRLERSFPPGSDGWAKRIDTTAYKGRITVILGTGWQTPMGVRMNGGDLEVDHALNEDGDGWVPCNLSCLSGSLAYEAPGVDHIGLPKDRDVIDGVIDILRGNPPASLLAYNCP
jgi:pimeloyl-ACP methyl ester carboxylesterase